MACVGDSLLPGDVVVVDSSNQVILGPGLRHDEGVVYATVGGTLRCASGCKYWVENKQKKYIHAKGDRVIGVVLAEIGDIYRVDIGSNFHAVLSYLSFEGATKNNRPNVKVGDVLYARVVRGEVYLEPELTCCDAKQQSSGMGVLQGGLLLRLSCSFSRWLLCPGNKVLKMLGRSSFEATVGVNGWVWVKGSSTKDTLKVAQTLLSCQNQDETKIKEFLANIRLS